MTKKPLVIYHAHCTDGLAAAWCFWNAFGNTVDYYAGVYNQPMPDIVDRVVYLVDFSYKRDKMVDMCKWAHSVTVLDHHKTALEDLAGIEKEFDNIDISHCTNEKSGAMVAWDYLNYGNDACKEPPLFLQHVQDRDLWNFELPLTKEIIRGATNEPLTIELIDVYMQMSATDLKHIAALGKNILISEMTLMKGILKECTREIEFDNGHSIVPLPLVNAPGALFSEMGDLLGKTSPGVVMYYDTKSHRVFGLRSNKEHGIDVSAIAKMYGGGGHKNAAGFKVTRDHPLATI